MKNSTRFFLAFSLSMLILCISCSAPSSEVEMKAAQEAMDKAKSFHAETLAASNWSDAMQAWEQGEAAVKEGKSAKTFFLRAKSRFEKTAAIAKANGEVMSGEVRQIQQSIDERLSKIKAALEKGKVPSKSKKMVQSAAAEGDQAVEAIEKLMTEGDYLKALTLAKDTQTKLYNTELVIAGKKPAA
jgi:hypothetical protein